MGQITLDQSHQILTTLAVNTDWASIDFTHSGLQDFIARNPKEVGRQFTAFLRNGGKVLVDEPKIVVINRGRFNPTEFIGKDWSIITEETDTRSTALNELDLTKVQRVTMLNDGETYVKYEEKLKRLKTLDLVRLDADIFYTFWENQHLIPESWKKVFNRKTCYIFFDGTIFRNLKGARYALYLYWNGVTWGWNVSWLGNHWNDNSPSAVLVN